MQSLAPAPLVSLATGRRSSPPRRDRSELHFDPCVILRAVLVIQVEVERTRVFAHPCRKLVGHVQGAKRQLQALDRRCPAQLDVMRDVGADEADTVVTVLADVVDVPGSIQRTQAPVVVDRRTVLRRTEIAFEADAVGRRLDQVRILQLVVEGTHRRVLVREHRAHVHALALQFTFVGGAAHDLGDEPRSVTGDAQARRDRNRTVAVVAVDQGLRGQARDHIVDLDVPVGRLQAHRRGHVPDAAESVLRGLFRTQLRVGDDQTVDLERGVQIAGRLRVAVGQAMLHVDDRVGAEGRLLRQLGQRRRREALAE